MVKSSGGENQYHIVAARLRLTGSGNLQMAISDLDGVKSYTMVPLVMAATTNIEPTRLSNIQSQRLRFEGMTSEIDETFHVRRLILFAKEVAVEYPM